MAQEKNSINRSSRLKPTVVFIYLFGNLIYSCVYLSKNRQNYKINIIYMLLLTYDNGDINQNFQADHYVKVQHSSPRHQISDIKQIRRNWTERPLPSAKQSQYAIWSQHQYCVSRQKQRQQQSHRNPVIQQYSSRVELANTEISRKRQDSESDRVTKCL